MNFIQKNLMTGQKSGLIDDYRHVSDRILVQLFYGLTPYKLKLKTH